MSVFVGYPSIQWIRLQHAIPNAQFGGRHAVSMLPGGGIGPELMHHVRDVFTRIGVPVDFEIIDIHPASEGNDDLDYAITSIKRNGVAIKGMWSTSIAKSQSQCVEMQITVFVRIDLVEK